MIPHAGAVKKCLDLSGNLLEIDRGSQNNAVGFHQLLHDMCGVILEHTVSAQNALFAA